MAGVQEDKCLNVKWKERLGILRIPKKDGNTYDHPTFVVAGVPRDKLMYKKWLLHPSFESPIQHPDNLIWFSFMAHQLLKVI